MKATFALFLALAAAAPASAFTGPLFSSSPPPALLSGPLKATTVAALRDGAPTVRTEALGNTTIGYDATGMETLSVTTEGDGFRVDVGSQTLLTATTKVEPTITDGFKITVTTSDGVLMLTTDAAGNALDVQSTLPEDLSDALSNHNAVFSSFNHAPPHPANPNESLRMTGCQFAKIGVAVAGVVGLFPHPACTVIGGIGKVGAVAVAIWC